MKPEANIPNLGPEHAPVHSDGAGEYKMPEHGQEDGVERGAERTEQISELRSAAADAGLTTVLPTPVSSVLSDKDDTTTNPTPVVANDDDLIEKEWVDKAKKIVEDTKNDPYKRDDEVGKLRVDYIKKRFGRELGSAE
jgi:hypothetical protein